MEVEGNGNGGIAPTVAMTGVSGAVTAANAILLADLAGVSGEQDFPELFPLLVRQQADELLLDRATSSTGLLTLEAIAQVVPTPHLSSSPDLVGELVGLRREAAQNILQSRRQLEEAAAAEAAAAEAVVAAAAAARAELRAAEWRALQARRATLRANVVDSSSEGNVSIRTPLPAALTVLPAVMPEPCPLPSSLPMESPSYAAVVRGASPPRGPLSVPAIASRSGSRVAAVLAPGAAAIAATAAPVVAPGTVSVPVAAEPGSVPVVVTVSPCDASVASEWALSPDSGRTDGSALSVVSESPTRSQWGAVASSSLPEGAAEALLSRTTMGDLDGGIINLDLSEQSDAKKRLLIQRSQFLRRALDSSTYGTFFQAKLNHADLSMALTRINRLIKRAHEGAHTPRAERGARSTEVELAMRLAAVALPGPNQARIFKVDKENNPSKQCKVFTGMSPFVDASSLSLTDIIGESLSDQPLWVQFQMVEEVMVFWFGSHFVGFMAQAVTDARMCELYKGLHPDFVRWNYMEMALPQFYAVMTETYVDRVTREPRSLLAGAWKRIGVWEDVIADEVVSGIEGLRRAQDYGSYTLPVEGRPGKRAKHERKARPQPRVNGKGRRSSSPVTDSHVSSDSDDVPEAQHKSARIARSPQRQPGSDRPPTVSRVSTTVSDTSEREGESEVTACLEWALAEAKLPRSDGRLWKACPYGTRCRFSHDGNPPRTLEAVTALVERSLKSATWKSDTLRLLGK
jgi:hypothetical protein